MTAEVGPWALDSWSLDLQDTSGIALDAMGVGVPTSINLTDFTHRDLSVRFRQGANFQSVIGAGTSLSLREEAVVVPEPAAGLLGAGLMAAAAFRRRQRKSKPE